MPFFFITRQNSATIVGVTSCLVAIVAGFHML
jgi:hypothetical protein